MRRRKTERTLQAILKNVSFCLISPTPVPELNPQRRFCTTHWSLVVQSRGRSSVAAQVALEELCSIYWLPVYAFMRRQTDDVHTAQDWTQGFFTSLLSRDAFDQVDPSRGRFRSFLLASARHYVSNERDRERAQIRGGTTVIQSLDFERAERILSNDLAREPSAESLFERQWALAVLSRTMDRLRGEHDRPDKRPFFDSIAGHLSGVNTEESLQEIAARLDMTPESVRVGLHRLRKRYRRILREEIDQTTLSSDQFDDEIRQLFNALRG